MSAAAPDLAPARPTCAALRFLAATEEKPVYYASVGGGDAELQMEGLFEERTADVEDGRVLLAGVGPAAFSLDREGFALVDHASRVSDFYDDDELARAYDEEVEALLMGATGAARVVVFDHTRRGGDTSTRQVRLSREPTNVVHNDYTEASAPKRVRDLMPAEKTAALLSHRFAIFNVWRPINRPVESWPLALCDAQSIEPGDLVASERRAQDRIGELTLVRHNPAQRWVYFPAVTPKEAVLIKTFDSDTGGRARWSMHSAFIDPASAPDAQPRESIESRAFAFFG